jgi:hypothetical protein
MWNTVNGTDLRAINCEIVHEGTLDGEVAAMSFSTLSTLRALRHVRPSVESELVWRGEREGMPAFACLPACQPWTPAVATPRGAGVPERPRNRTS